MQDKALIRRLKAQDENALKELIAGYSAYVTTIIRNVGRTAFAESDVEELAADVFIAVWEHADDLHGDSLKGYLGVTARHKAINHLRGLRFTVPMEEITLQSTEDIQADTERRLLWAAVREIVDGMEQAEREILLRFYFYYQQTPQIAEEMHLKPATVKTRLHRARKKLLKQLQERGYEYEG